MKNNIVGEDMICPTTKQHCDDECCPVGAICNLSYDDRNFSGEPSDPNPIRPMTNIEINQSDNDPNIEAEEVEHLPNDGLSIYIDPKEEKTTRIPVRVGNKELTIKEINDKIEELKNHTINGFRDKKGLEKAKEFKSYFLKGRTSLEKESKEQVIQPINKVLKIFKGDVDEVCDTYKTGQELAQEMIDAAEKEWELEQERIEKEKHQRINDRIARLQAFGATFDAGQGIYTFDYSAGDIINTLQLQEFSDEEFTLFVDSVGVAYVEEQKRLETVRIEQEKEQERLREAAEQLKVANARIAKYRIRDLQDAGAIVNANEGKYTIHDKAFTTDVIYTFNDEEWDELLDRLKRGEQKGNFVWKEGDPNMGVEFQPDGNGRWSVIQEVELSSKPKEYNTLGIDPVAPTEPEQQNEVPSGNPVETEGEDGMDCVLMFSDSKSYVQHTFSRTAIRIYPKPFEQQAMGLIPAADIQDRGVFGDTTLRFVLFKLKK